MRAAWVDRPTFYPKICPPEASGADFEYDAAVVAMAVAPVVGPVAASVAPLPAAVATPMAAVTITPMTAIVIGVRVPARPVVLDQNDV